MEAFRIILVAAAFAAPISARPRKLGMKLEHESGFRWDFYFRRSVNSLVVFILRWLVLFLEY